MFVSTNWHTVSTQSAHSQHTVYVSVNIITDLTDDSQSGDYEKFLYFEL